jgi:hypothetical protein
MARIFASVRGAIGTMRSLLTVPLCSQYCARRPDFMNGYKRVKFRNIDELKKTAAEGGGSSPVIRFSNAYGSRALLQRLGPR